MDVPARPAETDTHSVTRTKERGMVKITFDEQEDDWWTCTSFQVRPGVPPIRLTLTSDKEPAQPYIDAALRVLEDLDALVLKASERHQGMELVPEVQLSGPKR